MENDNFKGDSVRAFAGAIAVTIRSIPQGEPFTQETFLAELASVLSEYGPNAPDHNPHRWAEVQTIGEYLGHALDAPVIRLFDPPEGPPH